jgi:hypothetical protein
LKFLGYVTQQYIAKSVRGVRQPVNAYDKIIRKIPSTIKSRLVSEFSGGVNAQYELGQIPNLHSLVPLSQNAHVPVFKLTGKDGVVGAHFAKVSDSADIFEKVADNFLANLQQIQCSRTPRRVLRHLRCPRNNSHVYISGLRRQRS